MQSPTNQHHHAAAAFLAIDSDGAQSILPTCPQSQSLAKSHQLHQSHGLIIETKLDDMLGASLFKQLLSANQGVPPTIFITVRPGSTKEAVEARTLGAVDYIEQPFFARQLIRSIELALAA